MSYSFVCIRPVTTVRKREPLLGVKSNAAKSPTITRVLLKRERRLLKMMTMGAMCQFNTSA